MTSGSPWFLSAYIDNAGFHGLHPARLRRGHQLESRQFLFVIDGDGAVYVQSGSADILLEQDELIVGFGNSPA